MAERLAVSNAEERFQGIAEEYGRFLRNIIAQHCPKNLGLQINDIEQEARLRLWRALQKERELTDAASYIYRVAVTTTIDAVRRVLARHEEQLHLEEEDGEASVPGPGSAVVDPEQSPDRLAERHELIQKVNAALARLPDNRRTGVELYLQGLTGVEIAKLTGWSEAKTRNTVYRGLKDLRQQLRAAGIMGNHSGAWWLGCSPARPAGHN